MELRKTDWLLIILFITCIILLIVDIFFIRSKAMSCMADPIKYANDLGIVSNPLLR